MANLPELVFPYSSHQKHCLLESGNSGNRNTAFGERQTNLRWQICQKLQNPSVRPAKLVQIAFPEPLHRHFAGVTASHENHVLSHAKRELVKITERFDDSNRVIACDCLEVQTPLRFDGGCLTQGRLLRAAENQLAEGPAILSRYRIWAETLRGSLISVADDLAGGTVTDDTRRSLLRVTNSLAAFCEIQAKLDR